ncbi:MAG TPA: hypothetical protein VIU64_12880, partial [Polyangia bacterium]
MRSRAMRSTWAPALALGGLLVGATVQAAPGPAAEDIRDIHGPIATPARRPVWPFLVGAGLL